MNLDIQKTRRIVIVGNSSSGKSTLAKTISESNSLPHLDLDTIAWQPSNPDQEPVRKPEPEIQSILTVYMHENPDWVIEGCYADILQLVAPAADALIFLDLSISKCIANARSRSWEPHKYESKAAQDANLPMLIDWIKAYENRTDDFSRQAHLNLYQAFKGPKLRCQSRAEITRV